MSLIFCLAKSALADTDTITELLLAFWSLSSVDVLSGLVPLVLLYLSIFNSSKPAKAYKAFFASTASSLTEDIESAKLSIPDLFLSTLILEPTNTS